jgi:two-component system NtrC family response regulator
MLARLDEHRPDLILLDVFLGSANGIDLLRAIRADGRDIPVIMMTAHSEVSLAVQAMKQGATDFVVKPFDLNHLLVLLERNLDHAALATRVRLLEEEMEAQRSRSGVIGRSAALRKVLEVAEKLAQSDNTTVLLEGESGTGKEVIARFLCNRSVRADKPFITVNCGAIPKELAESEFFGFERGAFTGAGDKMRQGKFELAHGGTILLDEIGELSLDMQVKLLRVLEERRFYRLGGTKEIAVDVRVIAASNRDLAREVEEGHFREDLYYRLNVASIKLPPLRKRREDITDLTLAFLNEFCARYNRPIPRVSQETLTFLEGLPWKGNVRELRNAIERVVLLNSAGSLAPEQFAFLRPAGRGAGTGSDRDSYLLEIPPHGVKADQVLRDLILKTLALTAGNQVRAAKLLGMTRSKLRYRMDQLGVHPEQRTYTTLDVSPRESVDAA